MTFLSSTLKIALDRSGVVLEMILLLLMSMMDSLLLVEGEYWRESLECGYWRESFSLMISPMSWKYLDIICMVLMNLMTSSFKLGVTNWNHHLGPPTGTSKLYLQLEPPTCTTNWTHFNSNLTYINNGQITVNNNLRLY